MKIPKHITFTGVDDRTDLNRANELSEKYPIEWGILFSNSNKDARYPSIQGTRDIVNGLTGMKAAHVCGEYSLQLINHLHLLSGTPHIENPYNLHPFKSDNIIKRLNAGPWEWNRIQINIKGTFKTFGFFAGVQLIKQWRDDQFDDTEQLHMLYDRSGGRGIKPDKLPHLLTDKFVGYAGGITSDNVIDFLSMVEGEGEFWIDMESGVRTNGWFDLDKVEVVCKKVYGNR